MTNVDENGTYPLDDTLNDIVNDEVTKKCNAFGESWKEHLSFLEPVVNMTYEEREVMKKFAWKIFEEAFEGFGDINAEVSTKIQQIANEAYADGVKDTLERVLEAVEELDK